MTGLRLPVRGGFVTHVPARTTTVPPPGPAPRSRVLYAAAHVVPDPLAEGPPQLDWDATLAYRHHLWRHGLGVADAMDTAQRGMGLGWASAAELIRRSGKEAAAVGGLLACGAGTDQLEGPPPGLDAVVAAYREQCEVVLDAGSRVILMASRALAAVARGPEDYATVYGRVLDHLDGPVILHWLGPAFDPQLAGYWGSADLDVAAQAFVALVGEHAAKIDGVKVSLLDAGREVTLRRALPPGVRCYTGDDLHYPELIRGDRHGHSDALLGILDAIGPHAAAAARALDDDDPDTFTAILEPTVPLARHVFAAPTFHYKTGIVFLAWLAGHQRHPRMVGGLENARSVPHLARLYQLADTAGLFGDPEAAAARMRAFLDLAGVAR